MIYISGTTSKTLGPTRAFSARGMTTSTIGPVGGSGIFAIPNEKQLAYTAYRDNLEAFLYATAVREKVLCAAETFGFPDTYIPTFPLRLPATVICFKRAPDSATMAKIRLAAEGQELEEVAAKDPNMFLLRKPEFSFLKKLVGLTKDRGIALTGMSQMVATKSVLRVYAFIDAFLATNTYSFKREDFAFTDDMSKPVMNLEMRQDSMFFRAGFKTSDVQKKAKVQEPKRRKVDDHEVENLTPHHVYAVPHTAVVVAKPSLNPSSASFGSPRDVPNKAGMVFPYFKGMLQPDTAFIRNTVHKLFFRLFGDSATAAKENWLAFRENLGVFSTTDAGIEMSHVLAGLDLAMQSQTQVFLLFDNADYMGFVLLGEEYRVQYRGAWFEPKNATQLREDLLSMYTHENALSEVVELMKKCTTMDAKMLTVEDVDTCEKMLDQLSMIDVGEEGEADMKQKLVDAVRRLNYPGAYLSFSPKNIRNAIEMLCSPESPKFGTQLMHIPTKNWEKVGKREYQILSSFGPRSFSLIEPKGDIVRIPRAAIEGDFFTKLDDKGALENTKFIVYEKDLITCISNWTEVKQNAYVKMNFKERAAGSRAQVYKGEDLILIWSTLKEQAQAKRIGLSTGGEPSEAEPKKNDKGKKRAREDDDEVDFSVLF